MSRKRVFACHRISPGTARGEALLSVDDICFYLVDPRTGIVLEKGHDAEGRSVSGKVLIFPSGKGSSVVQTDGLYHLQKNGQAPSAMIVRHPDTVLVAAAIIMEIPLVDDVDEEFYRLLGNNSRVTVDADHQTVALDE
jgi:predicted aconitase with swiveling domain